MMYGRTKTYVEIAMKGVLIRPGSYWHVPSEIYDEGFLWSTH